MKKYKSKLNRITTPPTPLLTKEGGTGGGLIAILLFLLVFFPTLAFAQDTNVKYNLIQPLPGVQDVKDFPEYISVFIPFLLGLAGLLSLIQIVRGGIMRAVSGGNPSAIGDANDMIWQAILGLLLALSAYLILNTINPDLVNLKFKPLNIQISKTSTQEEIEEEACQKLKCTPAISECKILGGQAKCVAVLNSP